MAEIPLVVINMQRGGPSTGLPTKTEQADLFQAVLGRNGECPIPVVAAATPGDCFWTALEAVRIAVRSMTPVILLSDGYLANSAEPWPIPKVADLPEFPVEFRTDPAGFMPYLRDPRTLARPWAVPGTPGLEHRIGGLEKQNVTGNVNYEPGNHELMVKLRDQKVQAIADFIPLAEVAGPASGKILVVGWGSTYGAIKSALRRLGDEGIVASHLHLRHMNPFPRNLGEILGRFETVLVPEMNLGQLAFLLRGRYLVNARSLTKVQGKPFKSSEIADAVRAIAKG
jgi:2-oxoglutarate ferredoxin oxidoreductase subunit alpha